MKVLVCAGEASVESSNLQFLGTRMPVERRLRWARTQHRASARAMVLAYWLARVGVDRYHCGGDPAREWNVGPWGKPFLSPGMPHFNVTHSESLQACAISSRPVGIDVELIDERAIEAGSVVMSVNERIRISSADNPADEATRLWTMKESYVKRSGEGLTDGITDLDVTTQLPETRFDVWRTHGHWLAVCSDPATGAALTVEELPARELVLASQQLLARSR